MGNSAISRLGVSYKPIPKKNESVQIDLDIQYKNASEYWDYMHNKYQSPDYAQVNLATKYYFKNAFEGLHLNFLYTYRITANMPIEMTAEQQYYRTNLHHFNLVLDIVF